MNLKTLSDEQLLTQTSNGVDSENRITASVIKHLFEINRRRLYLNLGYGSLFGILHLHYRYCEATAQLRKNAVYLIQDVPEVIAKIESGAMPDARPHGRHDACELKHAAKSEKTLRASELRTNRLIEPNENQMPQVKLSRSIAATEKVATSLAP